LIFDTHRKGGWFVSAVEVLTEIIASVCTTLEEVVRFAKVAEHAAVLAIPHGACFIKGNLHVYASCGPVRGFDPSVIGASVTEAERKPDERTQVLWGGIPVDVLAAQRELLAGTREARYPEDLDVPIQAS
jgi:hypothetical protein